MYSSAIFLAILVAVAYITSSPRPGYLFSKSERFFFILFTILSFSLVSFEVKVLSSIYSSVTFFFFFFFGFLTPSGFNILINSPGDFLERLVVSFPDEEGSVTVLERNSGISLESEDSFTFAMILCNSDGDK